MSEPGQSFVEHPLALLAGSFACGIVCARLSSIPLMLCLTLCATATALTTLSFAQSRLRAASILLAASFCFAGWTLAVVEKGRPKPNRIQHLYDAGVLSSGDPLELTGTLEPAPEPAPDGLYLTLRVERLRFKEQDREASGVVRLFAPATGARARAAYDGLELRYGARINVMVALRRAESFRNPGVSPLTEYLERRGYDATGTIKSPLLIERLEDERVFLPLALIYACRQRLLDGIDEAFNAETGGVLKAALLGNRYYLSRASAERFREGGTFHILVISGLHISFVGGIVLFLMRRLTRRRALQFAVSVLFLWGYTVAVGAESSVVRAALMFTVVALAPLVHRRARSLNALGAAMLLLLICRQSDLFDPSFQLTFLSVLAIVTLAWPLLRKLEEIGGWRPTAETPRPPESPRFIRTFAEMLFWSESEWRKEMKGAPYSYRLRKTRLAAKLERWRVQRLLRYSFGALLVSACVQIMLLPLLVLYFHRLPLAGLILNIGVGALMAALSLLSLTALVVAQINAALASPLVSLAEHLSWLMVHSVDPFARAHLASIRLPEYQGLAASVYVLYYLPLLLLLRSLSRWQPLRKSFVREKESARLLRVTRASGITLAALAAIIILHPFSAPWAYGRLRVDFLDVGQGDSALVTMPDGTTMLVDGGGHTRYATDSEASVDEGTEPFERDSRSIGEAVVAEYLWWRGLDRVDYVLATHADADHIDGLCDILKSFGVRAAFVGRTPPDDEEYRRFALTAYERGVPVYILGRGDALRFGEVNVDVLWPERTANMDASSRNNDSVVLRLRLGERSFLLTGDIEKKAEAALVSANDGLRSDVVKVAHHGSRTSSIESFVGATSPQVAVISVGLSSVFGHPHEEVLERWRASGARILTTGRSGTITVSTDGRDLRVETFLPP